MSTFRFFICALSLLVTDLLAWGFSFALTASGNVSVQNLLILTGLWLCWHGGVQREYFRRQPFWTELLGLIKGTCVFMGLTTAIVLNKMAMSDQKDQFFTYQASK